MNLFEIKRAIKQNAAGKFVWEIYYRIAGIIEKHKIEKYWKTQENIKIQKYHNCAKRDRCFIVGNGPSLTVEDLMLISGEDVFAANRIYGVFGQCTWRPKYYCVQDDQLLISISNELSDIITECENVFLSYNKKDKLPALTNVNYLYTAWKQEKPREIGFSKDCSRYMAASMTVTYWMIQLAVYMGYKEIYLIGVDHNYVVDKNKKATNASYASFIKETDLSKQNAPHTDLSTLAYMKAKEVCEPIGVKIYNSTRGGKLEVFERKSLENVLAIER